MFVCIWWCLCFGATPGLKSFPPWSWPPLLTNHAILMLISLVSGSLLNTVADTVSLRNTVSNPARQGESLPGDLREHVEIAEHHCTEIEL